MDYLLNNSVKSKRRTTYVTSSYRQTNDISESDNLDRINMSKRSSNSPLICRVCGDVARGLNFDVITCMSCKAFFRRNACSTAKPLQCQLNDDCIITKQTRGECSACRLKKCLSLGMNRNLIRSPPQPRHRPRLTTEQDQPTNLQLTTVNSIRDDRLTLTFDEWNLLSQILHVYDEQNIIHQTQSTLKQQLSLPPKLRSKNAATLQLIGTFYSTMKSFLERSPYYNTLSSDQHRLILENNLIGTGTWHFFYAAIQTRLFDHMSHLVTCNEIYGEDFVRQCQYLINRMESNGTLIKIMLMILSYASNSSIVVYEPTLDVAPTTLTTHHPSTIPLFRIQEIFVTMLWKYLVYQYGLNDAIRRFNHLVKNYLDILNQIDANPSIQHREMIHTIMKTSNPALQFQD